MPNRSKHVGQDAQMEWGTWTTVAAVDVVQTKLKKVEVVIVSQQDDPVDGFASVSAVPSGLENGQFSIKSWQNTGGTDPTPAAAVAFTKKVAYFAIGY